MAVKETIEGYQVIATVSVGRWMKAGEALKEANLAAELIPTHVSPHAAIDKGVYVEAIVDRTCEHCGREWTESSTTYNDACCGEDEAAKPADKDPMIASLKANADAMARAGAFRKPTPTQEANK